MEIHGLNKVTLLDYPQHVACTVFTGHCNLRCPFCQNGDLVLYPSSQPVISEDEVFAHLDKRKKMLEGVAITGGEPTLQADLYDFIVKIKEMGFLVKLDTNGTNPDLLIKLIEEKLIDFTSIDIKSSAEGYPRAVGIDNFDITPVLRTIDYLINGNFPYEFRTTVCRELHTEKEFEGIAKLIKGCSSYYLQAYSDSNAILIDYLPDIKQKSFPEGFSSYTPDELRTFVGKLNNLGINAHLRGFEE